MGRSVTVSTDAVHLLLKYLDSQKVNIDVFVREKDIEANLKESQIPLENFKLLWQNAAVLSGDNLFGLHFGEAISGLLNGHLLYFVMMNSPTIKEALDRYCRYHGLLVTGAAPQLVEEGQHFSILIDKTAIPDRGYAEAVLAMTVMILRRLSNERVNPTAVHLAFSAMINSDDYQHVFGRDLKFDRSEYRLVYQLADLEQPIFMANAGLLTYLESFAQSQLDERAASDSWGDQVTCILRKTLLQGEKPELRKIANQLSVSTRTLQYQLKAEDLTYQTVLDRVRQKLAEDCLREGQMSVCDVAFLLGFSEQSAFNHAYKRWTGFTPLEFAKRRQRTP